MKNYGITTFNIYKIFYFYIINLIIFFIEKKKKKLKKYFNLIKKINK